MVTNTKEDAKVKENLKTEGPEVAEEELEGLSTLEQADKIVRNFVLWSAGGGLIPMPLADIAAIYAAQVTMIAKLSKVYDIPFSEHKFKNTLFPLFASLGVVPMGTGLLASMVKIVPGVGQLVSGLSMPVMAGAITYATGKVFTSHFEAGGTLLDFNPETMKDYYKELFEKGKTVAKEAASS
ncbi:DUF697 domain-containing protein [Desulfobulbus rhabdoformis]|uniref:YcjF family protein n=1 Tax=Desulfobulbus rhabdoformis TaxID=34032 RepID=UPI0019638441|nr:DUF697 domain-containing protein [Desulfobulbus rhabdoformis]MBM9616240.1 DUF697 domain-containing protein [Desulfobulbus rhabdoformis]